MAEVSFGPDNKPWIKTISSFAQSPSGKLLVTPPSKAPSTSNISSTCNDIPFEGTAAPKIALKMYEVPSSGLSDKQRSQAHSEALQHLQYYADNLLGYQGNASIDFTESAVPSYLKFHLNNHGDPNFAGGREYGSTKWIECNVLDYYASLWHAKWPHDPSDPESYWGYVLSMGSTEGNIISLYTARQYLSANDSLRCRQHSHGNSVPIAFYSEDAHNSIEKALNILQVPTFSEYGRCIYPHNNPLGGPWPKSVPSTGGDAGPGSIDIDALVKLVDFFSGKGHPIIVIFNYGTTFKGAYDDVKSAGEALIPILRKNNMFTRKIHTDLSNPHQYSVRQGYWFHIDGALGASYMPFVNMAYEHGLIDEKPGPTFDFQLDFVCSIVTSGHKWIRSPYPSGVLLLRSRLRPHPLTEELFSGLIETTLAGSRNGLSPVILWSYISSHSYDDQVQMAVHCVEVAQYTVKKLKELEREIAKDLWVSRSPGSLAVLFKTPSPDLCLKYSLPSMVMNIGGKQRKFVHVFLMQSVTKEKIDNLISDLKTPGAFSD